LVLAFISDGQNGCISLNTPTTLFAGRNCKVYNETIGCVICKIVEGVQLSIVKPKTGTEEFNL